MLATSLKSASRPVCYAFGFTPWNSPWMNRQQLLSRLGKRGWRVVYSTGAANFWDRKSPGWRTIPLLGRQYDSDGVRVEIPGRLLPSWPSHPRYDAWAIARYCMSLTKRAGAPRAGESIAYLFRPEFLSYALALGSRYLVYHAVDNYAQTPEWSQELEDLERAIVARADLLIGTTSDSLARLPAGGSASRHVLHNAADAAVYARGPQLPCPEDMLLISRPRICYSGRLNRKVDFNLIAAIARTRSTWQWALIGPVVEGTGHPSRDPEIAEAYQACLNLPNVHFLGTKAVDDLPAYMGHADVNVMCYRHDRSGWWADGYPLKLHEYLACGKPIVSTPLSAVQPFGAVVDLAVGIEEWIRAIEHALSHGGVGSATQRVEIALANTWDHRVEQLETWLNEMIDRQGGSKFPRAAISAADEKRSL